MKPIKCSIAFLLVLMLLLSFSPMTSFVGLKLFPKAQAYNVGDTIQFGTYPQTIVDETIELKAALNAATWKSYKYFSGKGSIDDGKMTQSDYMCFADFFLEECKYRAVSFSQYRPRWTGFESTVENTYQDENGYEPNIVYYFRYEPLTWKVLDPTIGLIVCDRLIDSQPYQNTVYNVYNSYESSIYANDYPTSTIRQWLNIDFYQTAFSKDQRSNIKKTQLNNDAYSTTYSQYNSDSTNDKLFLLSFDDLKNTDYGFNLNPYSGDIKRTAKGTDYAKCQGLYVYEDGSFSDTWKSKWWSRSPGNAGRQAAQIGTSGIVGGTGIVNDTSIGVRPACCMFDLLSNITLNESLFSSHEHKAGEVYIENTVEATCIQGGHFDNVVYCEECGEEIDREVIETKPIGHNYINHDKKVPTCTEIYLHCCG